MKITVLSGGVGGARFLSGLLAAKAPDDEVTVIGNTADDIWLFGMRVCPDLDTVMYTLGNGIDPERRWGRTDETWNAKEELGAYGEETWFGLGDRDLATHLIRTKLLHEGVGLAEITARLCERWQPGVRLLPMTEDEVETHIGVDGAGRHRHDPLPGVLDPARRQGAGTRAGVPRSDAAQRPARVSSTRFAMPTW